ncbi:hypothetical protein CERSUDRAFT_91157 [Gelatoporia subvermispora B]|uniref:Uncharacterized protein n=1 Tax=Ceriporiopsis subvermispora (strain B) TaxID=914234 RepID=M2RPT4_CERS8|nr:hypothetical protein CERSUDRAFT_91157 [Gelatoporia subvermispora B]
MSLPLDKAAVVSTTLEAILYGFSVMMFGLTMKVLVGNERGRQVNKLLLTVSCLLFVFSTMHTAVNAKRVENGLVTFRDTFPGGPTAFFSQPGEFSFLLKNAVYMAQTLTGDGFLIYRCYMVWRNVWVIVFPLLVWLGFLASGIMALYAASRVPLIGQGHSVFEKNVGQWITAFYSLTLAANLVATGLLAYKIWRVDRRVAHVRQGSMMPIVHIIVDVGALYSAMLISALACFVNDSNGQYIILDIATPIISITFYMVILRVGMAAGRVKSSQGTIHLESLRSAARESTRRSYITDPMRVHVTQQTEHHHDGGSEVGDSVIFEGQEKA